jgi:hypothetical protein
VNTLLGRGSVFDDIQLTDHQGVDHSVEDIPQLFVDFFKSKVGKDELI